MLKIKEKPTMEELKNQFLEDLNQEDATAEQTAEAMANYVLEINNKATEKLQQEYEELKDITDNQVLAQRGIHVITAEEKRFYNEVKKTGTIPGDELLPETIIERVFDDIAEERPLLKLIKFTPSNGRKKIITSQRLGKAVWGPLHKDLDGQLDAVFDTQETELKVLTGFFLISNDTLDLGPRWIDRYIRLCLQEAVAEAWEEAIVSGTGKNEPIGLIKDLDKPVVNGVYADKDSSGTLTLSEGNIVKEFAGIMKSLSVYDKKYTDNNGDEKTRKMNRRVDGKVNLVVNPTDYYDIITAITVRNANGEFISRLPFISYDKVITSVAIEQGTVVAMVDGGYEAHQSFNNRIYQYKETFAMNRATLIAIDMFGDGTPIDNSVAKVYKLDAGVTVLP